MRSRTINLTEGVIWKQVLLFAIPLLLSNLLQQLYSAIDLIIVGNFTGPGPMAAIGATGHITNMIIGLFMGLATGVSVIISMYYGAYDYHKLQESMNTAYAIAIYGGLILSVIGYFFSPIFLSWMGTPEVILEDAITYMQISFIGSIPNLVYNMGAGILRSVGDSKRPFYFLIISTISNLILDIIFVWGFSWGVVGAGWATVLSQIISASLVTLSLTKAYDIYRLSIKNIKIHLGAFKDIVKIGIPAGLQGMLISLSNVVIQSHINSFGPVAVGGVAIATRIDNIVFSVLNSFALTATTFSGQNVGAGMQERVKRGAKEISFLTFVSTFGVGMIIFTLRYYLVSLFIQDSAVIEVGARMVSFLTPFYWMLGLVNTLGGYIRGSGESLKPMLISLLGMVIFRLAYLYIVLDIKRELEMVFLCYPISWFITLTVMFIYYKKGSWREQAVLTSTKA